MPPTRRPPTGCVTRDDGKLVFKLPMTTVLNYDAPFTPEGVRVCPVAGV
jgi:hypothetical protein